MRSSVLAIAASGLCCWLLTAHPRPTLGAEFLLRNGLTIRGATGDLSSITENPLKPEGGVGEVATRLIRFVDDGLRRTYFYEHNVLEPREDTVPTPERIRIRQPRISSSGKHVVGLSSAVTFGPFDGAGHRSVSVMTKSGVLQSVQAITELTPLYAKVEGLVSEQSVIWDMRVATSNLSRDLLVGLVSERGEPSGADGLLALVRLLIAAERYHDAAEVLKLALQKYPELKDHEGLQEELNLRRMRRLVSELKLRRAAGQHEAVQRMIAEFPVDSVPGEILLEVREIAQAYTAEQQQLTAVRERLQKLIAELDPSLATSATPAVKEITEQLSLNNLARMSDFLRLGDAADKSADQRLAWAISGWVLGAGAGVDNFPIAVSMFEIRDLVTEYLRTTGADGEATRQRLLDQIIEREGGTPENVAKILATLRPPIAIPKDALDTTGAVRLNAPSSLDVNQSVSYLAILPPAYDPDRRYPTIISLPNSGVSIERQAEWWSGAWDASWQMRMGQASRHGYIVIVPDWADSNQSTYGYSLIEHARVLDVYRHALQRFAIDTDRVYLSGHGLGGDAAWDIAFAHPDLWAGMIVVGASSDYGAKESPKYITKYAVNGKQLPMYFVYGELDMEKINRNSRNLNDYLRIAGYDAMLVEYKGRGNEHFYEEIQRLFDWMEAAPQRRNPHPAEKQFEAMRPWDNFFWCLELSDYPPPTMTHPLLWGQSRRYPSAHGEFRFVQRDRLVIKLPSGHGVLWLSPEWVDFSVPIRITVNGDNGRPVEIRPQVSVMLNDARTRGDRRHPFWSRTEL